MTEQTRHSCPDAETLAAFTEGKLTPEKARDVSFHLAECSHCTRDLAALAAFERELPLGRRWSVYLVAAAVIVCTVVPIIGISTWLVRKEPRARLAAAAAALQTRPTEARLSFLSYATADPPRGPERFATPASLRLAGEAGAILATPAPPDDAAKLHLHGIAWLLAGNPSRAIEDLTAAVSVAGNEPQYWSDLAAARHTAAMRNRDDQELARALAAVDRALMLDPRRPEALFNRALILEALHLDIAAVSAYEQYLAVDSSSGWATEARQRISRLLNPRQTWREALPELEAAIQRDDSAAVREIVRQFPQDARTTAETLFLGEWAAAFEAEMTTLAAAKLKAARLVGESLRTRGEPLLSDAVSSIDVSHGKRTKTLAHAHQAYLAGRVLYHDRDIANALPKFEEASSNFANADSAMALLADYYRAMCLFDADQLARSAALVDDLFARTPSQYRSLRAQLWWQRGSAYSRAGLLNETLHAHREALRLFEESGEAVHATTMLGAAAATEAMLGRAADAWRTRVLMFRTLSDSGSAAALQVAVELAARTEAFDDRWDTAHSLFTLAIDPRLRVNQRLHVNATIWRGLAAMRLGWRDAAFRDLRAARSQIATLRDAALRATATAHADFVEGAFLRERDPESAERFLSRMISQTTAVNNAFLVPHALIERARARRSLGNVRGAISDLRASLEAFRGRRTSENDPFATLLTSEDDAADELVDLLERSGQVDAAFAAVEAARETTFNRRVGKDVPEGPASAPSSWPEDRGILVMYVVLPDRLLSLTCSQGRIRTYQQAIARGSVEASVSAIVGGSDSAVDDAARTLHRLLIAPILPYTKPGQALTIIPDRRLGAVPFAALRDTTTARFVVEDFAVVIAPTAKHALRGARHVRSSNRSALLALANPLMDEDHFPSLEPLPASEREVATIAQQYPESRVLIGKEATKQALSDHCANASVVHIATHAVHVPHQPSQSFIVLAPGPSDAGAIYAHEIAGLALQPNALVVLSGCRTAGPSNRSSAVSNLALAFLSAGASNAVGTLWDVDDDVSRELGTRLHRHLREGTPPIDALRLAQLEMLHHQDSSRRSLRAWGAFQLIGTGY